MCIRDRSLIQMEKHPLVVFVTKRHEYAVQGYGLSLIHILVINKPTAELIGFYPDGTHEVFDLSDLPAIICSVDSPDELSGCRSN